MILFIAKSTYSSINMEDQRPLSYLKLQIFSLEIHSLVTILVKSVTREREIHWADPNDKQQKKTHNFYSANARFLRVNTKKIFLTV